MPPPSSPADRSQARVQNLKNVEAPDATKYQLVTHFLHHFLPWEGRRSSHNASQPPPSPLSSFPKFCVSLLGRALLPSLCSLVLLISDKEDWDLQHGRQGIAMRSCKVTFGSCQQSESEGGCVCFSAVSRAGSAYPVVFLTTLFLSKGVRTRPRPICHVGNRDQFALKSLQKQQLQAGHSLLCPFL